MVECLTLDQLRGIKNREHSGRVLDSRSSVAG